MYLFVVTATKSVRVAAKLSKARSKLETLQSRLVELRRTQEKALDILSRCDEQIARYQDLPDEDDHDDNVSIEREEILQMLENLLMSASALVQIDDWPLARALLDLYD